MRQTSRWTALLLIGARVAASQSPGFEVVSVRPSAPDAKFGQTTYDPGSMIARAVSLKQLIEWAYQVTDVQVSGGPSWMDSKFFDVEAKAESAHSKDELEHMLQPVLAERFKLALHSEMKEMTVQVLTVGRTSAELHQAQGGPANIKMQGKPPDGGNDVVLEVIGQSASTRNLADYLTGIFGTLVEDQTGLTGSFDFKVDIEIDQNEIITDKRSAVIKVLTDAIAKLGLKLGSKKESVEILAVDHAEPPSEN